MIATARPINATPRKRGRKSKRKPVPALSLIVPSTHTHRPLPRLRVIDRTGAVLRPNPLSEVLGEDVWGLNLTLGCPHLGAVDPARAHPNYPGDDSVFLYADTATRLRRELGARKKLPRAVYLSSSTDPFIPYAEVQAEAGRVLEVLAEFGVECWCLTRGLIRPSALEVLAQHRELVRVTVAVNTIDNQLRRVLEPFAAPPALRLRQVRQLKELGINTQVTIDPLIPHLTDTKGNLEPLLDGLKSSGVHRVTTAYMILRQGIRENIERELGPLGWADSILNEFQFGPVLPMGSIAPARHLPRAYRQKGYALLMSLAAMRGINVSVSSLTNPDFSAPRLRPHRTVTPLRQLVLEYGKTS